MPAVPPPRARRVDLAIPDWVYDGEAAYRRAQRAGMGTTPWRAAHAYYVRVHDSRRSVRRRPNPHRPEYGFTRAEILAARA